MILKFLAIKVSCKCYYIFAGISIQVVWVFYFGVVRKARGRIPKIPNQRIPVKGDIAGKMGRVPKARSVTVYCNYRVEVRLYERRRKLLN